VALRPWVSPGVPFSTVIPVYACRKPVSRKLARRQWRSDKLCTSSSAKRLPWSPSSGLWELWETRVGAGACFPQFPSAHSRRHFDLA